MTSQMASQKTAFRFRSHLVHITSIFTTLKRLYFDIRGTYFSLPTSFKSFKQLKKICIQFVVTLIIRGVSFYIDKTKTGYLTVTFKLGLPCWPLNNPLFSIFFLHVLHCLYIYIYIYIASHFLYYFKLLLQIH